VRRRAAQAAPAVDDRLASGDYTVALPEHVPATAAFATVKIDAAIYAFSIASEH
jgi:hypothetical protein